MISALVCRFILVSEIAGIWTARKGLVKHHALLQQEARELDEH